jgi:hypothetical protein
MKKIVRLTESELENLIKRVIKEQQENLNEAAVVNGVTINSGQFLSTVVGSLTHKYKVNVDCGKDVPLVGYVSVYAGPVVIEKLWNGKDGGIAGSDNTGKIFEIPIGKASSLANQMKNGVGTIKTSGSGKIAGVTGSCKVNLTKKA